MIAIIIAGSRTFDDYKSLKKTCIDIISKIQYQQVIPNSEIVIVSGGAKGADTLALKFAKEFGLRVELFPADWEDMSEPCIVGHSEHGTYNKLAGIKRNKQMAEYARANKGVLIAFNESSPGIKDMIKQAAIAGVGVYEIKC